jgi:hypothetical protein
MSLHPVREHRTTIFGNIPYRLALAGGWIDQPFVSRHNPTPPGSMVVLGLEPEFRFMDRCGMGTSTRAAAAALWGDSLPPGDPADLVKQLYLAENRDSPEPSGSQDMAGLIYPGISRLDYDFEFEGGYFPCRVESCCDIQVTGWLEQVVQLIAVNQRPPGYNPLGEKNLDPLWIGRLGRAGEDCFTAILARDAAMLGETLNETMRCWEVILPDTVHHPTLNVDLLGLLGFYQSRYPGAMYSGCGGGYLVVVSEDPVPGAFRVRVRISHQAGMR